ncbi:MAG: DNA polymerase III, subunit gamma and tau [Gammaproteobacteria bacterium RIFCSPHIGHO2_12_FULL_35_23]|nr:MAG: DNA polymerase III, subunit gamma and tau [Gammaproteobacteria bacterium RIFCSPHIGHO2_12_FULL_35_23]
MNYQVLARKWRPQTFTSTLGQQHVLQALKNALDQNRLHHAYLFTGTRGVGKTSIARILAKALNCEQGISSNPCGQCTTCKEIEQGRFIDLIEVDAASRTKVEDTRELLDNVQYAPTRGRFKIYLIDEVHMLSGHSFNALLKTLEEPPAHVKFLLATTDPQKLPITVLSRCLQFHLKSLSTEQISKHLQHILTAEQISFEEQATLLIAKSAKGSIRDALSLLEQTIAYCQGKVTTQGTGEMLGTLEQDAITPLLNALIAKDGKQLLAEAALLAEKTVDYALALEELTSLLHYIAIAQVVPEAINRYQINADNILKFAAQLSKEDTQLYYQIALIGKKDLELAPDPKIGFEMTLLRMLAFHPVKAYTTNKQSPASSTAGKPTASIQPQISAQPSSTSSSAAISPAAKSIAPLAITTENWDLITEQLNINGLVKLLATNCSLKSWQNNQLTLILASQNSSLLNDKAKERLKEALNAWLQAPIKLTILIGQHENNSPMQKLQNSQQQKQQAAFEAIAQDPLLKEIINTFDTALNIEAVKPNS